MACMCGDLYCGSCGPAQGNFKCRQCGMWSMDGGCANPAKCNALEAAAVEAEYEDWKKTEKEAAEYWAAHPERE